MKQYINLSTYVYVYIYQDPIDWIKSLFVVILKRFKTFDCRVYDLRFH